MQRIHPASSLGGVSSAGMPRNQNSPRVRAAAAAISLGGIVRRHLLEKTREQKPIYPQKQTIY